MTVEEYLHTSFEVEPDYLDGELVDRHVGSLPHARAKGRMLELLRDLKGFSWHAYLSITMIMSPTRCRVADLALFAEEPPPGKQYPDEPGELAIEIIEREDRFAEMLQRLSDYRVWGFSVSGWLIPGPTSSSSTIRAASTKYVPLSYPNWAPQSLPRISSVKRPAKKPAAARIGCPTTVVKERPN
jgi:hypothetical protein